MLQQLRGTRLGPRATPPSSRTRAHQHSRRGVGLRGRQARRLVVGLSAVLGPRGFVQWPHHHREIIILGPAAAGRRRFCRVLRRVSGCCSASSGLGRDRGCQQLDGEVARVRRGRVADSCLRTHVDMCVVCAFASVPHAVCKLGMTTVLKTSSLLLSSRIPIDRVPLGSENIE